MKRSCYHLKALTTLIIILHRKKHRVPMNRNSNLSKPTIQTKVKESPKKYPQSITMLLPLLTQLFTKI